MAHILPSGDLLALCGHGTPLGRSCQSCRIPPTMPPAGAPPRPKRNRDKPSGWTCPSCRHSYAPWVPECRHCPDRDGPVTPPDPPPYEPVLGAIRWGEDPWHSPSRPRRLSCWLIFWRPCIHQGDR